jgi:beta-N-acetylhexosaminidase
VNALKLPSVPKQDWLTQTLSSLTLREKIGQTIQEICPHLPPHDPELASAYFEENPIGSVFCGGEIIKGAGSDASTIRQSIDLFQKTSKVPLLVAGDLEYGAGASVSDLTVLPSALALGAANDESLAYEYGKHTAMEGKLAGFNWTFSPVVDLLQNWLNPIVSNRSLGDNPEQVSRIASALIRGIQDHGMAACAKHFPGDGVDFRDQHLVTTINSLSKEQWKANHGHVFQKMIDQGVCTIMPGHIALNWLEPVGSNRPRPATVSKNILTHLLRNQMRFNGVIVSDALIMAGFTGWAKRENRLIEAFNAGIDIMLWPGHDYFHIMERAIDSGKVYMERLDASVRRIFILKARLGLLSPDSETSTKPAPNAIELRASGQQVARNVAQKSITLVRNRSHLLPLSHGKIKRILVQIAAPPQLQPKVAAHIEQIIARLKARSLELTILKNGNCLDITKLEAEGKRWDAYLVFYSLQTHQIKNSARPVGEMAEVMWTQQTAESVEPIVISLGTPFLLHDMPYLNTLVNCYGTAPSTIEALDRALFGEIKFSEFSPVNLRSNEWYIQPGIPVSS